MLINKVIPGWTLFDYHASWIFRILQKMVGSCMSYKMLSTKFAMWLTSACVFQGTGATWLHWWCWHGTGSGSAHIWPDSRGRAGRGGRYGQVHGQSQWLSTSTPHMVGQWCYCHQCEYFLLSIWKKIWSIELQIQYAIIINFKFSKFDIRLI